MAIYFASGSKFNPPKADVEVPAIKSITGTLSSFDVREGRSFSGKWLVIKVKKDDELFSVYFDYDRIVDADILVLQKLNGRIVTLTCEQSSPLINSISVESEGSIRERLLEAVASGNIHMDDLPALLEFANGKDELFEKWKLFKQELDIVGLEKKKDEIFNSISDCQRAIDKYTVQLSELKKIYDSVYKERQRVLSELQSDIYFLQGENGLVGTKYNSVYASENDNIVSIDTGGYTKLIASFAKFKTAKDVYVICDGKFHRIHHAYLEEKGRAFLIGESKQYASANPEKLRQIIDEIHDLFWG